MATSEPAFAYRAADLEQLCRIDGHPELRDRTMAYFPNVSVRYILTALIQEIDARLPEETRDSFVIAVMTAALGVVAYDQFTIAVVLGHRSLETALRQRFEVEHPEGIPLTLKDGTVVPCATVSAFAASRRQFRGSKLVGMPNFDGSYSDILSWCAEHRYLTADSAARARYGGFARNELTHTSDSHRLMPGTAINSLRMDIDFACEAWAGRWSVDVGSPIDSET